MPRGLRQYHGSQRLDNIQRCKENVYKVRGLAYELQEIGVIVDQQSVTTAISRQKHEILREVDDELREITNSSADQRTLFLKLKKLNKAIGRIKID